MTVNNTDILQIVNDIETEYKNSTTHYAILFSKLAIIEFCGWIEETFDDILIAYCFNLSPAYLKFYKEEVIDNNYGFHYERNFRPMLLKTIGIGNLESLENCLENHFAFLSTFKSILGSFSKSRNSAAHTYTKIGVTNKYDAPSIVISNIKKITPILEKIEQEIMKY
jgi:hypothetical protein